MLGVTTWLFKLYWEQEKDQGIGTLLGVTRMLEIYVSQIGEVKRIMTLKSDF